MTITLVAIGVICIVVSLLNREKQSSARDFYGVSAGMSDEQIHKQKVSGGWRGDAKMGLFFGAFFIALGLVWQLFLAVFWV